MERLTKRGTRTKSYVSAIGSGVGCWGRIIDRLAAYENTGLEPEEIMGLCSMHERSKMAELLRNEENRPLILDELREMDGEPVWIERCGSDSPEDREWALVFVEGGFCKTSVGNIALFALYGIGWLAYRRKRLEGG